MSKPDSEFKPSVLKSDAMPVSIQGVSNLLRSNTHAEGVGYSFCQSLKGAYLYTSFEKIKNSGGYYGVNRHCPMIIT